MSGKRRRSKKKALGRGLDTIIQDTASGSKREERADEETRERVSEIVSVRVTPRQKEFITLYDKYRPKDESFAETFRRQLDRMERDLGPQLREIEVEAQALAKKLLR